MGRFLVVVSCGVLVAGLCLSGCGKRTSSQDWSPHYHKAVDAYRRGHYPEAISFFEKALLYEPSNREILLDIAAIYDDFLGDASTAISYYERYLRRTAAGEKAKQVRRWADKARQRLVAPPKPDKPEPVTVEGAGDKDQLIETLRGELRATDEAIAREKEKTKGLLEEVAALSTKLSSSDSQLKALEDKFAAYEHGRPEVAREQAARSAGSAKSGSERQWLTLSWLVSISLFILVVALVVRQRSASASDQALLASIQASAAGETEQIQKDDILGKYFWVENDRSAGTLSFTEKDGEMYACAIDGTTGLRARGKGRLVENILTAELKSPDGQTVVTKFIFANKGRTLTAIWQGEEGTCIAAGTKAVED